MVLPKMSVVQKLENGDKFFSFKILCVIEQPFVIRRSFKVFYCECECGKRIYYRAWELRKRRSCGCKKGNVRYGDYDKKAYSSWRAIQVRCNENAKEKYKDWAGRGITICDGYLDFNCFYRDVGDAPSSKHSIDRIDNNGHYSCGKCNECIINGWGMNIRWATREQQASNTRKAYRINIDGELVTLKDACKIKGLPYKQVHERVKRGGWDICIALNTPVIKATSIRYKKLINDKA